MKFEISRVSGCGIGGRPPYPEATKENGRWVMEINTVEELIDVKRKCGEHLIIEDYMSKYGEAPNEIVATITIYDAYRE